jgi:hypothetical protein
MECDGRNSPAANGDANMYASYQSTCTPEFATASSQSHVALAIETLNNELAKTAQIIEALESGLRIVLSSNAPASNACNERIAEQPQSDLHSALLTLTSAVQSRNQQLREIISRLTV